MLRISRYSARRIPLLAALALALSLGALLIAAPRAGLAGSCAGTPPADLRAALIPSPGYRVVYGSTVSYRILLQNTGDGEALWARVTLPYQADLITPIGGQLDASAGDWVSAIAAEPPASVVVTFGRLPAGAERSATLTFQVNGDRAAFEGRRVELSAEVAWGDHCAEGVTSTNATSLRGSRAPSDYSTRNVAGPPRFRGDGFVPGELVSIWLNVPGEPARPIEPALVADDNGEVRLIYEPADLPPGRHELVMQGQFSQHLLVLAWGS